MTSPTSTFGGDRDDIDDILAEAGHERETIGPRGIRNAGADAGDSRRDQAGDRAGSGDASVTNETAIQVSDTDVAIWGVRDWQEQMRLAKERAEEWVAMCRAADLITDKFVRTGRDGKVVTTELDREYVLAEGWYLLLQKLSITPYNAEFQIVDRDDHDNPVMVAAVVVLAARDGTQLIRWRAVADAREPGKGRMSSNQLIQTASTRALTGACRRILGYLPRLAGVDIADGDVDQEAMDAEDWQRQLDVEAER